MTFDFRASQLRTSKIIASGTTGTNAKLLLYPISADGVPLNQGNLDPAVFSTGSIGQDVFLFVSGGVGGIGGTNHNIALFGGDIYTSGNLKVSSSVTSFGGFSGSLQKLTDGTNAFLAGPYIMLSTQSNGAVAISSSLSFVAGPGAIVNDYSGVIAITGSSYKSYQPVASYITTTLTSSTAVGQFAYVPTEVPSSSIILRVILSNVTGSSVSYVKLYNHTSGSFVCIGGGAITILSSSATIPTKLESVNLATATNWSTGSSVYELQLYSSSSLYPATLGNAVMVYS